MAERLVRKFRKTASPSHCCAKAGNATPRHGEGSGGSRRRRHRSAVATRRQCRDLGKTERLRKGSASAPSHPRTPARGPRPIPGSGSGVSSGDPIAGDGLHPYQFRAGPPSPAAEPPGRRLSWSDRRSTARLTDLPLTSPGPTCPNWRPLRCRWFERQCGDSLPGGSPQLGSRRCRVQEPGPAGGAPPGSADGGEGGRE